MDLILPLLLQLAITSPLLLLWTVGIVLAALRLREPRFRLVLLAMVLFLVLGVAGTAVNLVLPVALQRQHMGAAQLGAALSVVGIVRTLLESVGWILLLVALFQQPSGARPLREGQG